MDTYYCGYYRKRTIVSWYPQIALQVLQPERMRPYTVPESAVSQAIEGLTQLEWNEHSQDHASQKEPATGIQVLV